MMSGVGSRTGVGLFAESMFYFWLGQAFLGTGMLK